MPDHAKTELIHVPNTGVLEAFTHAELMLNKAFALAGDRYADGEIQESFETGDRQLWFIAADFKVMAVVVTRVFKMGVCQIELCSENDISKYLHHLEKIEKWAADTGCSEIEVIGTNEQLKKLKKRNYKQAAVILRKKL